MARAVRDPGSGGTYGRKSSPIVVRYILAVTFALGAILTFGASDLKADMPDLHRVMDNGCPRPNPAALARLPKTVLSKAKILEQVKIIKEQAAKSEKPKGLGILKNKIANLSSANLTTFGAALCIQSLDNASSYVLAEAALKNPSNVLAFVNLGAALNSLRKYEQAVPILAYAGSIAPKRPIACRTTIMAWYTSAAFAGNDKLYLTFRYTQKSNAFGPGVVLWREP
ncbi:MAG: hypothetical protein Q7T82_13550 [Armatimonadota bacterium]|nr:hypothetical protein [Armatimonadota bacterium]